VDGVHDHRRNRQCGVPVDALTKTLGHELLITEQTKAFLPPETLTEPLPDQPIEGKGGTTRGLFYPCCLRDDSLLRIFSRPQAWPTATTGKFCLIGACGKMRATVARGINGFR
jgi:hypothetical protein